MRKFESLQAKCPFYLGERHQLIYCEGIKDHTVLHVAFDSADKWKEYTYRYCCDFNNYENCLVARMLNEKYNDEEKA